MLHLQLVLGLVIEPCTLAYCSRFATVRYVPCIAEFSPTLDRAMQVVLA